MMGKKYGKNTDYRLYSRAIKLTTLAYFCPMATALCLLQLNWFFNYPSFSAELWFFLFIFSLPLILIALIYVAAPRQRQEPDYEKTEPSMFFSSFSTRIFFILTIINIGFMSYRYLVIGSVLTDGVTGARYAEIGAGPGQGGVFTGVTIFTAAAPIFLLLATIERVGKFNRISTIILLTALLGVFVSFLSGGRNAFLINVVFFLMFGFLVPSTSLRSALRGRNLKKLTIRAVVYTAFVAAVGFSFFIFVSRGLMRSDDLMYRAILAAQESNFIFIPDRKPDWIGDGLYFALLSFHNYLTVAFYYLDQMLRTELPFGHLGGSYNFFSFFRVAETLYGGRLAADLSSSLPFIGAYYTLPGSIYVDFGKVGVAIGGILLPVFSILLVNKTLRGNLSFAPIAALCLTVLAFSPLYNSVSVGSGPSLLLFSVVFALRLFSGRKNRIG